MATSEGGTATVIDELEELFELPAFDPHKGYRLVFLDDDHNTMDAVTRLFMAVFKYPPEKALKIMLKIHMEGRASVFEGSQEECTKKKMEVDMYQKLNSMDVFNFVEKIN